MCKARHSKLAIVLTTLLICLGAIHPTRAASAQNQNSTARPGLLTPQGVPSDPAFFPLAVWLQSPDRIAEFKSIGINLFVGFWGELDEASLHKFAAASMGLIPQQTPLGLSSPDRAAIVGWDLPDEPDNAQPGPGGKFLPCIAPDQIIEIYNHLKSLDPSRPVLIGLGRGVSDFNWRGRGACFGQISSYYPRVVLGADIISYDIFPVGDYDGQLEIVPRGIDNLKRWIAQSGKPKPIWNAIEAVPINSGDVPTQAQLRSEVWMSIIHGSQGIVYFVHQFDKSGDHLVREDGIFNFPPLVKAVTSLNAEITSLAPVLNSPNTSGLAAVSDPTSHISIVSKRYDGAAYVFAANERNRPTAAAFTLSGIQHGRAQALGEDRELPIANGTFNDAFAGYGVHLYKIIGE